MAAGYCGDGTMRTAKLENTSTLTCTDYIHTGSAEPQVQFLSVVRNTKILKKHEVSKRWRDEGVEVEQNEE